VVYIATGAMSVGAARASAESVRRTNPKLPLALFTDSDHLAVPSVRECFDGAALVSDPHRRSKVDYLAATPFERTLYLDADTRVYVGLDPIFALFDRFDIALAHAHARNRASTNATWRTEIPACFPQFNGGVIAYRSTPAVLAFMQRWREAFHVAGVRKDQVTLRELLWESDLRIATLPPEYNVRYLKYLWLWKRNEASLKILHHARFRAAALGARLVDRVASPFASRGGGPS
jgi:hypothetical protein